jgi:phage-related protein
VFNATLWSNPIFLVVLALVALGVALVVAYKKVGWFRAFVDATWQVIQKAFHAIVSAGAWLIDFFKAHWPLLLAIITGPIGIATLLIIKNFDKIKAGVRVLVSVAMAIWHGFVSFYQWVASVISAIGNGIVAVWRGLVSAFNWVRGMLGSAVHAIAAVFRIPLDAANSIVNGIKGAWNGLVSFISGIVGAVSGAVGRVAGAITGPINRVINVWNGLEFRVPSFTLPSFDTHIPGIGKVGGGSFGGWTIGFPDLPHLATGGLITSPGLAYLHAAEVVVPAAQAGRTAPVVWIENAHFGDAVDIDLLMQRVAWAQTRRVG